MIRAALARTEPSYRGLRPPFGPGADWPELVAERAGPEATDAPNPVYAAVRGALFGLGLDADRFGGPAWNPLGALVGRGDHVVLKPNFIRHWNPLAHEGVECVITHGAVLRAVADYAWLAVGREGRVTIAEAPQMDCCWERVREICGLSEIVAAHAAKGFDTAVIDLRQEEAHFEDGIVVRRTRLAGDPAGYRVVELGDRSFFHDSGLDPDRMRGADYDPGPTALHHRDGSNAYLLSETVLSADLVVNLPKVKTHKKTGVTLSQKNLVGINGDKNWLPHHCVGSPDRGGDEYPGRRWLDALRSRATDWARPWLQQGRGIAIFRMARRAERATRGDDFVRAGNWYGNRTTWRMCLDLNRCFLYSDARGLHLDATFPVRPALHLLDGIVAGEDNGPLAPRAHPLGVVIASTDPVAADLVAVRLMGFDETRLPLLARAMAEESLPITSVRTPSDVEVVELRTPAAGPPVAMRRIDLDALRPERPFLAHPGWRGHIEDTRSASPPLAATAQA